MTAIQKLRSAVKARFPAATVQEDRYPSGKVWLDVRSDSALIVVEFGPSGRIGISAAHGAGIEGFGEGPDRVFTRYSAAERHLLGLLSGSHSGSGAGRRRAG